MIEKFKSREYLDEKLNKLLENEKFLEYYKFLVSENNKYNLTRITEIDEVFYKHFYDSIFLYDVIETKNKTILDVGSGAGFPSIPLKIIEPTIKPSIIDALNKRIEFLKHLIDKLDLHDVKLIHGRAEELSKSYKYDIVTARAVSKLNILAELTLPFVKLGGYFIAFKSVNYQEELNEAGKGIEKLGGVIDRVVKYPISREEEHVLIIIKKIKNTPEMYPRHFGKIKKSPL
jgi:16S rRNA (guanine527-N7)-methyltransferase